jgi:hypothetical protein
MKFQVGDTVLVKVTQEEGEVIDIINDQMVMVEIRGVKFPAYTDQLDFPYFKRFSQQKIVPPKKTTPYIDQVKKEKVATIGTQKSTGVWLTFNAVFATDEFGDDYVTHLKIYLHNQSETGYRFTYQLKYGQQKDLEISNQVLPFQDFYLHDIPFANLNDSPSFHVESSLLQANPKKADYYESMLKLKPKQIFQKIKTLVTEGSSTFSYLLFDQYPDKIEEAPLDTDKLSKAGFRVYAAKQTKSYLPPARTVIDLHIEKIMDHWKDLSNHEILLHQIEEFEKWYQIALQHHQPMLTVIHGVGSGRLRDELHQLLRLRKEVKYFVNQYHPSFGHGATEIHFQY